jgi:hypothetical protein
VKIYKLWENGAEKRTVPALGVVITPDNVNKESVIAAWSYAVHHTPATLSTPNYRAALSLLLQRHPSWEFVPGDVGDIWYQPTLVDKDTPDL